MSNDNQKGAKQLGLSEKKRITESPADLGMAHVGKDMKPSPKGTKSKSSGARYR